MNRLTSIAVSAGAAIATLGVAAPAADAQHHRGDRYDHYGWRDSGWHGPRRSHFVVYAWQCPDLREDRRDRRVNTGWRDRREDRRDRRVLSCPPRAWSFVQGYNDRRRGPRFTPREAYWDPRSGRYWVQTRRGAYPVHVVYGRGFGSAWGHRGWDDRRWRRH